MAQPNSLRQYNVFLATTSGVARICCEEGQRLKLCHGALTVDFGAGCSSCLMTNRSGFYQLQQIRPAIRSLTPDAARTIVQAFIACHLDCCNSLLYGVPENLLRKVQSVQNAAARDVPDSKFYYPAGTG